MNQENKKIVMFDFDGVLMDTLIPCYTISSEVNDDMDVNEYKGFFDGNIHDAIRKNGEPRKYHPNFLERYNHLMRELKVPSVLKDAVKELSKSYTLVIISSTMSSSINDILVREGIKLHFEDILGSDVHHSKVIKIEMILKKYAVTPEKCIFITDTLGDIREAAKCHISSIAVTWGFQERKNLEIGNPVAIVDDPANLYRSIVDMLK